MLKYSRSICISQQCAFNLSLELRAQIPQRIVVIQSVLDESLDIIAHHARAYIQYKGMRLPGIESRGRGGNKHSQVLRLACKSQQRSLYTLHVLTFVNRIQ